MSQYRTEKIACPSCYKKDNIKIYEAIDSTDIAARKRLLDGSLFTWRCPKCNYRTNTVFNLLYKNEERHFMVYLAADGDAIGMRNAMDKIEKDFNKLSPSKDIRYNMARRIVLTSNELREKVMIFEAALDDRIIEIMKCFYMSAVIENSDMQIVECLFNIDKDQWSFEFIAMDGRIFSTPIRKELYEDFEREYKDCLGEENEYFVHSTYALGIYNKHELGVDKNGD